MFAKVHQMKILYRWLWITLSLSLWAILAVFSTAYLIKKRAFESLNQISEQETLSSSQIQAASNNIYAWLFITSIIQNQGLNKNPQLLLTLNEILEKLVTINVVTDIDANLSCLECPQDLQSRIKNLSGLITENKNNSAELKKAYATQENLKQEKQKKIDLHSLLSQDFAELLGSTSIYQSKGKSQLLYYKSGPFKWLPQLDDSVKSDNSKSSVEVDDLTVKLEKLRNQSRTMVEEYLKTEEISDENSKRLSSLETANKQIGVNIKRELLEILKAESSKI